MNAPARGVGLRRMSLPGFTVALIGPDGAGKTTIARALERDADLRAQYIYMGVNWEASNHLLPTTRVMRSLRRARGIRDTGGPPERPTEQPQARPLPRRLLRGGWTAFALANRIAEEWYRQILAWLHVRRGGVVVFDRHFFSDYHADDVDAARRRSLDRRIHGYLLARVYPQPQLVVFLDAPAEVLHARKGEGTIESLERRRQDYLRLADAGPSFTIVDAAQPLDEVTADVAAAIRSFRASRATGAA